MGECSPESYPLHTRMLLNPHIQHHTKEQRMGYDLNMIFGGAGLELPSPPAVVLLANLRLGALGARSSSPNSSNEKRLGNCLQPLSYP